MKLFGINLLTLSEHLTWIWKKKYTSNLDLELSAQDDVKEVGSICCPQGPRSCPRLCETHTNKGAVPQNYLEI